MSKRVRPSRRPVVPALIEAVLAIAALELGFFLFRLGAEWWRH